MTATLVLQSHRRPLPGAWLEPCLASVRAWAGTRGFDYGFEHDALFRRLNADLRAKTEDRPVIASDVARLAALEAALTQGYDRAVWLDADTLVIDPDRFELARETYALGREVWIQRDGGRVRAYVKVHNAFLQFNADNPFLAFYRHAAERILRVHEGPMAPQLLGPKLLTALDNLIRCPVVEEAAVLAPAVAKDLLAGGGPALALFRDRCRRPPAALNLCGSLVSGAVGEAEVARVIGLLEGNPAALT